MEQQLDYAAVRAAAGRIAGAIRPAAVVPAAEGVWYALEYLQHTGSFKARGARNFLAAHHRAGTLPEAGVTIASGGNAGLACAWAARAQGVPATVFLPANAPRVKVERLRGYGAEVRLVGDRYADALAACEEFAAASGALASHAYDHPLIAAGAGTLLDEIRAALPGLDTVVVAVGGGGLFAGIATAAREHGVRVVAAEPENSRALNAALEAGRVVDVAVDSVAGDSLGATRVSADALAAARYEGVRSVLVPDQAITAARRALWEEHRIVVEAGAATALAALRTAPQPLGERVAVVLCGANTDPGDLTAPGI
ncbi:serine/threonine dehydratase [Streptomyces goshikiensis]|uniref:serine/threonine dehydratase n=1 Tax=Streptomyces TaxID=1883 RepID=UPI00093ED10B|nr:MULTISPECIES: serine/threonine dehydratase [Streptomyces]MBP0933105.1 serine/threonine dehydratase [Streptomyces sp. KCTC 0041BP]OKI40850.1 threonine dehydratase [Streptomyces sp. CB03578]PJN15463.1 threonine dehydratase [Streptomyces sp. CB02120-2]GHD77981.1 threonine dehydratase [Streptomyces goshikiensis]